VYPILNLIFALLQRDLALNGFSILIYKSFMVPALYNDSAFKEIKCNYHISSACFPLLTFSINNSGDPNPDYCLNIVTAGIIPPAAIKYFIPNNTSPLVQQGCSQFSISML
jgi:hypothetical protein